MAWVEEGVWKSLLNATYDESYVDWLMLGSPRTRAPEMPPTEWIGNVPWGTGPYHKRPVKRARSAWLLMLRWQFALRSVWLQVTLLHCLLMQIKQWTLHQFVHCVLCVRCLGSFSAHLHWFGHGFLFYVNVQLDSLAPLAQWTWSWLANSYLTCRPMKKKWSQCGWNDTRACVHACVSWHRATRVPYIFARVGIVGNTSHLCHGWKKALRLLPLLVSSRAARMPYNVCVHGYCTSWLEAMAETMHQSW